MSNDYGTLSLVILLAKIRKQNLLKFFIGETDNFEFHISTIN